jgi:lipopolysaccharide transport protein LptA
VIALALALVAAGAPAARELPPIKIEAAQFEAINKPQDARRAIWKGNVVAHRGEVTLRCDRMTAHLAADDRVKRTVCEGHAEAVKGERLAHGEKAEFDNQTGVLTLTGDPWMREGKSEIRGEAIVFYVDEDRVVVKNSKVKIDPKTIERNRK